jgi:hypothetical protein
MTGGEAGKVLADLLKRTMPSLKSQAQYDAAVAVFDSTAFILSGIMQGDAYREADARKALDLALEAARRATEVTNKLSDVPDAASSSASEAFKNVPSQFIEQEIQLQLLEELLGVSSKQELTVWYSATKGRRDQVVSKDLRNELMDAIRDRKKKL